MALAKIARKGAMPISSNAFLAKMRTIGPLDTAIFYWSSPGSWNRRTAVAVRPTGVE